ncbi:MAG TPA: IucA/IucC family protein [Polyangiaceae bacterium]|nr:IucA/IucC family protein [Polyangiaceae bacterium]
MERLLMASVREELVEVERRGGGVLAMRPAGVSAVDYAPVLVRLASTYSMGRFDLAELPTVEGDERPIDHLVELLDRLSPELPADRRRGMQRELENSLATMRLSLEAEAVLGVGEPGEGELADWEGRVWVGHPLHPGARLRSGVTEEENRRFGPEWQARLDLPLLELPAEALHQVGGFCERLAALYPRRLGGSAGRAVVPVHPWSAERDIRARFADQFERRSWRFLEATLPARPTMSFRSVILETETGESYHLKLPVAIQTTGATRTVSVAATQNGPLMSGFLERFLAHPRVREGGLYDPLHVMREPASFHWRSSGGEADDRSRFLSGLLRTGPGPAEAGRRWLLPAAALLEPRRDPLFVRAAMHYGVSPEALFAEYVARLVPAQAVLCGRWGIGLEAHLQNTVVDLRGPAGQLPKIHFWYRDLGGIRLHSELLGEALAAAGLKEELEVPLFLEGSATSTGSRRDLASKFLYSVLQNHVGELLRAVARVRGGSAFEASCWRTARDVLEEHRAAMGEDLARRVFADTWDLKAMWRMRIASAVTEYTFSSVRSPWLAARRGASF